MKVFALSLLVLSAVSHSAIADEFTCSDDGYCHETQVTSEDLGRVDDSYCGNVENKVGADGACHQFSPCGADEGACAHSFQ
jgi:hypothetical protein